MARCGQKSVVANNKNKQNMMERSPSNAQKTGDMTETGFQNALIKSKSKSRTRQMTNLMLYQQPYDRNIDGGTAQRFHSKAEVETVQ